MRQNGWLVFFDVGYDGWAGLRDVPLAALLFYVVKIGPCCNVCAKVYRVEVFNTQAFKIAINPFVFVGIVKVESGGHYL
jgi:hypothetical protein